jgi:hypothetical protein
MSDHPEPNFFAGELQQYYLEHGITLSPEIIGVLSKAPLELTPSEKGLFVKFVLPRRHQLKQAMRSRFTRSGSDQGAWIAASMPCSQSIIGQIANEMLIEEEVMALGPSELSLPVMAAPLSAPKAAGAKQAGPTPQATSVRERRERPKAGRQQPRHQTASHQADRLQNLQPSLQLDADIPTIRPEQSGSTSSPLLGPNIRKGQTFKKRRVVLYVAAGIGAALVMILLGLLLVSWSNGLSSRSRKPAAAAARVEKAASVAQPVIALIVQDVGENIDNLDQWLSIDAPLTFSILPRTAHAQEMGQRLYDAGYRIMLHIPTEGLPPHQYSGAGQISADMDRDTVFRTLDDDLATVPHVSGIDNHEGQVGCANLQLMIWQCEWAKANNLFVVDSRTARYSMVTPAAEALGFPDRYNQVFLDEHSDPDYIKVAVQQLADTANSKGVAIGVCNFPRPNTPSVLSQMISQLRQQGIHFAFVQDVHN